MRDALVGKTALVTGASRGIGAGIARRFAAEGAAVALVARSVEPGSGGHLPGSLQELAAEIEADGGRVHCIGADLADPDVDRSAIVREVEQVFGPVDVLVNNAAACYYLPFESVSARRLHVAFEVNVFAPFQLAQACVPSMVARGGGHVVNLTSGIVDVPETMPFEELSANFKLATTYAVSKAALNRLTTALAAEYAPTVAVNAVAPQAAVATEGATAMMDLPAHMLEPMESMVEAVLALATCDPAAQSGRVVRSRSLLRELQREVRTLDGRAVHDSGSTR